MDVNINDVHRSRNIFKQSMSIDKVTAERERLKQEFHELANKQLKK